MLMSQEMKYFHGGDPLACCDRNEVSGGSVDDSTQSSIPPRYRDGRGGIDLEQVRRDQRRARQEVVRTMIRRLGKL